MNLSFKPLRIAAAALLCAALLPKAHAQTTGSFDTTITFLSQPRAVSIYVPPGYNPANSYKLMVALHGLGDTCSSYRTALISSLALPANVPNTIVVCPEAINRNTDFLLPAGNDAIIEACIALARGHYNIDTTNIILQGFSLGGRAALRYGLDHYTRFKGLLLNTPAVQGVKEALNDGGYTFNYANASKIPIYITHGSADIAYAAPIDTAYEQMLMQNGVVRYFDYPGMGHTIPPFSTQHFLPFFSTAPTPGGDADLYAIRVPERSCNPQATAQCIVRNTGADTIHTMVLQYGIGASTQTYTWNGIMPSFAHAVITLPAVNANAASQTLQVNVLSVNGTPDTVTSNNTQSADVHYVANGATLPLFEGFEGSSPTDWYQNVAGDFYTPWALDNTVSKTGTNSIGAFNTIFYFDNVGRREELLSPVVNLSGNASPSLQFDVAYNYHRYTPPYLTIDTVFADTLEISISTDCGDHYTSLYKKGGADLATFSSPILNPLSIQADYINPADSNWRREFVDLSNYASSTKAIVKFSYISALGGSINIDNVLFTSTSVSVKEPMQKTTLKLFPNPANNIVTIQPGSVKLQDVSVMDMTGKEVYRGNYNSNDNVNIDVAALSNGIYLFRLTTETGVTTRKVVIQH